MNNISKNAYNRFLTKLIKILKLLANGNKKRKDSARRNKHVENEKQEKRLLEKRDTKESELLEGKKNKHVKPNMKESALLKVSAEVVFGGLTVMKNVKIVMLGYQDRSLNKIAERKYYYEFCYCQKA